MGNVVQESYISVDEEGTAASAITAISSILVVKCAVIQEMSKIIVLDRQFVYMSIDQKR